MDGRLRAKAKNPPLFFINLPYKKRFEKSIERSDFEETSDAFPKILQTSVLSALSPQA
jgi:hypothetical protein